MIPDLAVVIVAYKRPDLLRATLESIARHTRGIRYSTIVIDNASPDPAIAEVLHEFPRVQYVRNRENTGFAAANNLGIRATESRYVALLNPDTLLTDDALTALVRWLDDHPDAGAAAPKLVQPDGTPQPYSYGAAPGPGYLLRRAWSHLRGTYLHAWSGDEPQRVDWVAGTCMIVRRAAIAAAGPLDEQFFLYFEDVDWGVRLNAAGRPVYWLPSIAVMHVGGGSVGRSSTPHYDRSLVRFYGKHYGGVIAAAAWLALRLYRTAQRAVRRSG